MAISKITLNGVTQIDLTSDTVTAQTLVDDYVAHGADGNTVTGELVLPTARTASDVTVSGATVTIPAGAYSTQVQKSVASGTAGTPTATKGAVNNHSIAVTPSVTNSTGYISGSTINGTAVTVSASELVSGDKSITANGSNIDVAEYSTVTVNVSGGGNIILGALRPDSELVDSWTYDKLIVEDEEMTIPAYSTSVTTFISSGTVSHVISVQDRDLYDYIAVYRCLATPIYSNSSPASGKQICYFLTGSWELIQMPSKQYSGISLPVERWTTTTAGVSRLIYFSSASAVSHVAQDFGAFFYVGSPGYSTGASGTTLNLRTPSPRLKGNTTYLSETNWNLMTDIRYQYIIELYRAPKSSGVAGYTQNSQVTQIINCLTSATGKLT